MSLKLTTDMNDPGGVPYFLWDEPMTLATLRECLDRASPVERGRLLGKIMREARDTDVWSFTTPGEVIALWESISRNLGRRRSFWSWLIGRWKEDGLLDGQ